MQLRVLGPIEATRDGEDLELGAPKSRALLSALALSVGRPVPVDTLLDTLWGQAAPPGAMTTLQSYVSGLRKVLEPGRARRTPAAVLVTVAPGYALMVPPELLDARRFAEVVAVEHRQLSASVLTSQRSRGELEQSRSRVEEALALWRGEAYAELGDAPAAVAERARLEELKLLAQEARAAAGLLLGEHASIAADLEQLTTAHPLRERPWTLRALALVRSGRQADALDALRQLREVLSDELGLDPGTGVRDMQARILAQDPALEWSPPPEGTSTASADSERPGQWSVAAPARSVPGPSSQVGTASWPMLGRDHELARLVAALDRATSGETTFAVLSGDPGIGKSRLATELMHRARQQGVRAVLGRCSQDDGAPPLYPWRSILSALDRPSAEPQGEGSDFAAWESVVTALVSAAREEPLLVVLDDLHWADTATLRVLRLLVESAPVVPLVVVATWRSRPIATGALADVAEVLGRGHAIRIELDGLDESAAAGIVAAVTEREPEDAQARALHERTDGNPFFLVEYSRLAGTGRELAELLAEPDPPTVVQEVVARRLQRLPDATRQILETASVIGRQVELAVLADCTGHDEDALFDLLDPAQASGLVREVGVDRFTFEHALVRDTLYVRLSPSRRARQHSTVARALGRHANRETEEARHWLAAGPACAAQAWRAAAAAGEVAMRAHAHPEASALFASALEAQTQDPASSPRDWYDVLVQRAVADRWAGRWDQLTATAQEAVGIADDLGDVVLAAEAATLTLRGGLWQSARHGAVHTSLVAALRRSLDALPPGDSALRCRCLAVLAGEIYYAGGVEERRALVDESIAMARRLDDRPLLLDVVTAAYTAIWVPETADRRRALAEEAIVIAREVGDTHAEVVAAVQTAFVLGELGRPQEMWERQREALAGAERMRMTYAELALQSLVIPWRAMAGDVVECDRLLAEVVRMVKESELAQGEDAIGGNLACLVVWRDDFPLSEDLLVGLSSSSMPTGSTVAFVLWRDGQEERARAWLEEHPPNLAPVDWYSLLNWGCAAAMGAYTGNPALASKAYALLAPYEGRSCVAGSGVASGPVDAYLALAAVATGEQALATRHADAAELLAEAWEIPLFALWWRGQRDLFGI